MRSFCTTQLRGILGSVGLDGVDRAVGHRFGEAAESRRISENYAFGKRSTQTFRSERIGKPKTSRRRPNVTVRLLGGARATGHFVIFNAGPARAKDVNFQITSENSPLVQGEEKKVPIRELGPGMSVKLLASFTMGTGTDFEVAWSWTNEHGTKENRKGPLSL